MALQESQMPSLSRSLYFFPHVSAASRALQAHTRPFTDRLSQSTAKGLYLVTGGEGEDKVWGTERWGEFGPGEVWYRDVPVRFGQQGLLSRCTPG